MNKENRCIESHTITFKYLLLAMVIIHRFNTNIDKLNIITKDSNKEILYTK